MTAAAITALFTLAAAGASVVLIDSAIKASNAYRDIMERLK